MALVDKKSLYDLVPGNGPVGEMNSLQGPAFANPVQGVGIHQGALDDLYESSVHNINYGPMQNDLNGLEGPSFANQEFSQGIHQDALAGIYQSTVHNINYSMTLYDLNGETPEQYLENLPEGLGSLIG